MKVSVLYKAGHTYEFEYERTNLFCPSCGKKDVWKNEDLGDYYMGSNYVCTSCGKVHHLDSSDCNSDTTYDQIINQINLVSTLDNKNY